MDTPNPQFGPELLFATMLFFSVNASELLIQLRMPPGDQTGVARYGAIG